MSHHKVREALGAYTVGALDPAERAAVESHLSGCPSCRDELASLAGLPGLLSRITPEEAATGMLTLPADHGERVMVAVARARRASRRSAWRWRAVAAALVLALGSLVLDWPGGPDLILRGPGAVAEVRAQDWGMVVDLRADELPPSNGYILWAVDDDHRATVASWSDSGTGAVTITGSCYMRLDALVRLEVTDPGGRTLLTLEA